MATRRSSSDHTPIVCTPPASSSPINKPPRLRRSNTKNKSRGGHCSGGYLEILVKELDMRKKEKDVANEKLDDLHNQISDVTKDLDFSCEKMRSVSDQINVFIDIHLKKSQETPDYIKKMCGDDGSSVTTCGVCCSKYLDTVYMNAESGKLENTAFQYCKNGHGTCSTCVFTKMCITQDENNYNCEVVWKCPQCREYTVYEFKLREVVDYTDHDDLMQLIDDTVPTIDDTVPTTYV